MAENEKPRIAVLTVSKRPGMLLRVQQMARQQICEPVRHIIIGHGERMTDPISNMEKVANGEVYLTTTPDSWSLGQCRNFGVELALRDYHSPTHVAMMDDDDWYGPGYLADLEESILANPWGGIYGIREYDIGFVHIVVDFDGGNIINRRRCDGGQILEGDRVTWVSGASVCISLKTWKERGLKYCQPKEFTPTTSPDGSVGGEDGGLWEMCKLLDVPIIRRPSNNFCAIRVVSEDGWGGLHAHTWGPLHYHPSPTPPGTGVVAKAPPSSPEPPRMLPQVREVLRALLEGLDAAERKPGPQPVRILIRRKGAAKKISLAALMEFLEEDPSLNPGTIRVKSGDHVLATIESGEK